MANAKGMPFSKAILLFVTSLATFSAAILSMAVNVALPSIGKAFTMDALLLGWVGTSFVLIAAAVMIPIGRIADIYGRNRIFKYGLVLFTISLVFCAVSPSGIFLILARVIQGIGASMIWGPAVALLSSAVPVEERGRAIGINTTAVYCGLSLGPFYGGFLTEVLGWESIFYIGAVISAVATITAFWKLRGEVTELKTEKLDLKGSSALIISLVLILYGFSILPDIWGVIFIIAGLNVMLLFYRIEKITPNPVLDINLFKHNKVFVSTLIAIICLYCATFAPNFLLSLYLQYTAGFSPKIAGAILIVQPIMMAIIAPFSGRISDKIEPVKVSLWGMAVTCLALILFALLSENSPLWFILTGLIILGIGFGLFASPITNAVMGSIDKKFFGVAAGLVAALRHSGQAISMAIVMILFAVYIGHAEITVQYYPVFLESLKIGLAIFALICLGGMLALIIGGKATRHSPGEKLHQ
jgi:EmrB/QacA subfamily drug resistance transporter